MTNSVVAHPIALASALAFYAVMVALSFPATGAKVASAFSHPTPPTQHYLLGFDTLRGFAAAAIVVGHFWYFTYPVFSSTQHASLFWAYLLGFAYKAVPIFCTLSGFLIYRSVLFVKNLDGLRNYAIRRFFRIYPVYVVGVLLSAAFLQFRSTPDYSGLTAFLSELFMVPIFGWKLPANPILWSLLAEVQFYLLLPALLAIFGRKRMAVLSLAIIVVLAFIDYPSRGFGIWKYFFFGVFASEISEKLPDDWKVNLPLFILGMALLILDFLGPEYDYIAKAGLPSGYMNQTLTLGVACGLILATLPHLSVIGTVLNVAPIKIMGVTSYSVFIIHPYFMIANFPLIGNLAASAQHPPAAFASLEIMPSWYLPMVILPGTWFWGLVCFLLVERPGMQLGKWLIDRAKAVPEGLGSPAE